MLSLVLMPELYFVIVIVVLEVIAIVIVLILYMIEHRKDKRLHDQREAPLLEELKTKNAQILHDAIKQSQTIVADTQNQMLKAVSENNLKMREFEEQIKIELSSFEETIKQSMNDEITKTVEEFHAYIAALQSKSQETENFVETAAKAKVNEFIEKFEQNLSDFLMQTQQKSLSAIDLELTSARNLIETYKSQQIKIINENILAMLERTLGLVMEKKLTLKDHMDLIYESLEKAKVEKFIV